MKKALIILTAVFALASCSKEYTCECTNPGGTYTALKTKGSKSKAEKKCKEYYDENFGNVVKSETFCEVK